jgi:phosphonate transport system permease protein
VENTLRYNRFGKAGMAILVVVVATILVDAVSGAIRRRIIEGGAPAARPAIEEPRLEPASLGR